MPAVPGQDVGTIVGHYARALLTGLSSNQDWDFTVGLCAILFLCGYWLGWMVLREHRGDGHFAALAAADIDGCEAVALRSCMDLRRENLQPVRGWTDEAWDNALARLANRGWVGADGQLTSAGQAAHDAVEIATDHLIAATGYHVDIGRLLYVAGEKVDGAEVAS